MNDDDLARRIVDKLDRGLTELPPSIVESLAQIRQRALHSRTEPASGFARMREWISGHRFAFQVALPAFFVAVASAIAIYLQVETSQDPFDIEAALLADELPLHAYTDPGFDKWLRHSSQDQQQ